MFETESKASSNRPVAAAMAMVSVGMSLVVLNIEWPRMAWLSAHLGSQWSDFGRGFVVGLAIALETGAVVLLLRRRRP